MSLSHFFTHSSDLGEPLHVATNLYWNGSIAVAFAARAFAAFAAAAAAAAPAAAPSAAAAATI